MLLKIKRLSLLNLPKVLSRINSSHHKLSMLSQLNNLLLKPLNSQSFSSKYHHSNSRWLQSPPRFYSNNRQHQ